MSTTYNYWCKNRSKCPTCEHCNTKGDLILNESSDDFICPSSEEEIPLKEMGQNSLTVVSVYKATPAQVHKERRKRSKDHFQKEVMPYLPKDEQRGFAAKGYRNK